ncbi:MAG: (d)CMP kinase [Gammaproteobacteria bacterium]
MKLEAQLITIDGPSASGKGLASRNVAKILGFRLLDSGLLYRAYGYLFLKHGSHDKTIQAFNNLEFSFSENNETLILEDGTNITASLRSQAIAQQASFISSDPITRENLLPIQRSFVSPEGLVADGRDMGSIVFPNAKTKIFITASIQERAQRRFLELQNKGQEVNMRDLIAEIEQRDFKDMHREISPLVQPEDAVIIDTTLLKPEEVVESILKIYRSNQSS